MSDDLGDGTPPAVRLWAALAAELRAARERAGVGLVAWAKKAGWHHSHLSNVEHGRTKASAEIAKAYDDAFSPPHDPTRLQRLRLDAVAADERARAAPRKVEAGGTEALGLSRSTRPRALTGRQRLGAVLLAVALAAVASVFVARKLVSRPGSHRSITATATCLGEASPDAPLPGGWQVVGDATVTPGGEAGALCVHSDSLYWGGIYQPAVPGCDYTFSADGRVLADRQGWGLAVRTSIGDDGRLAGHGLQYQNDPDPRFGGYRDTDYPSDYGTLYPAHVDRRWHHLSETVRGDYYMLIVDGRKVASGSLSDWHRAGGAADEPRGQACGGAFVRVWSGATVEVRRLRITPD